MQITNEQLESTIRKICEDEVFKIIFSNRNKNAFDFLKIELENKQNLFLESRYTKTQVFNQSIKQENLVKTILNYANYFKQINILCKDFEYTIKISKKDKVFVFKQQNKAKPSPSLTHNRTKNYIISEGTQIPILVDMGIFTKDFKIVNSMQDKFRQINRYLEILDDVIEKNNPKTLNIIDFGCGKSYLTFVVYYYLTHIKNIEANIVGLDLKEDVIKNCNQIAKKYDYKNLKFLVGDIKDYSPTQTVDLILTLHACDIATDYALFNAIKWGAKMILSVPCCQHEINQQFKSTEFNILNRYGIAKERTAAIFTDIIRCNLLKAQGYQVDLMEFIDFDATPKNLLIRATKTKIPASVKKEMVDEVEKLKKQFGFEQTLYSLLKQDKLI